MLSKLVDPVLPSARAGSRKAKPVAALPDPKPDLASRSPWDKIRSSESRTPVQVIVAHEGSETMKEASRIAGTLKARLGEEFEFEVHWWNFKRLPRFTAIDWAAQVALQAQMVICSVRADDVALPCKLWADSWRTHKHGRNSALVALLGRANGLAADLSPAELYWRRVAQSAGMDFFVNEYQIPVEPGLTVWQTTVPPIIPPEPIQEPCWATGPAASCRWGINE